VDIIAVELVILIREQDDAIVDHVLDNITNNSISYNFIG